ncbi:MAG: hypothetical protein IPN01_16645 [Deltaproteobacteria bacterium]|nr:hypothetical protein [Deltaproteobacteria bacterium]
MATARPMVAASTRPRRAAISPKRPGWPWACSISTRATADGPKAPSSTITSPIFGLLIRRSSPGVDQSGTKSG